MTYEWQEGWVDVVPDDGSAEAAEYIMFMRRGIMAAVNWIAEHPKARIRYRHRNLRQLATASGVDPSVPLERIDFVGDWRDMIKPDTPDAQRLCEMIERAVIGNRGEEARPTFMMMDKALHCAHLFVVEGWDEFSKFMFTMDTEGEA